MAKEQEKLIRLAKEALRCAQEYILDPQKWINRALEANGEFHDACTPFNFLMIMGYLPEDK